MKIQTNLILGSLAALMMTSVVSAEVTNIYTGKGVNSNTVNEGQVVINGKVMKGNSRKMTPQEQKELKEELDQQGKDLEKDMQDMRKELEGMFN